MKKLTPLMAELLDAVKKDGPASLDWLADRIYRSADVCISPLTALVKRGLIRRDEAGLYVLAAKKEKDDLKPGSPEAVKAGCKCPVLDNAHGKGRGGDGTKFGWYMHDDCPLHAAQLESYEEMATANSQVEAHEYMYIPPAKATQTLDSVFDQLLGDHPMKPTLVEVLGSLPYVQTQRVVEELEKRLEPKWTMQYVGGQK